MKKNVRKGVVVTERDKHLFRYLFVNKVATVGDIKMDIFGKTALRVVHYRLQKLALAGLVEAAALRDGYHRLVYSLTKKGFTEYIADENTIKRVQLKSDSLEHDLALLEIKRTLRRFKSSLAIYSENLLRSGIMDDIPELRALRELNPDAVVKLKVNGKIYFLPLEYEASSKSPKRNAKLLSKYYTEPQLAGVIFISKTGTIEKKMRTKEAARKTRSGGKFYYALLEDVLKEEGKLSFVSIKNGVLSIE